MNTRFFIIFSSWVFISIILNQTVSAQDSLNLSSLDGYNHGFYVDGASFGDKITKSLASGDINGDGIDDLIVGADDAFSLGPVAGNTYVIYGRNGQLQKPFDVGHLNGNNGFAVYGDVQSDRMGASVSAGDFNGDGKDDLIMGAPLADPFGVQTGEVYVLLSDRLEGSSSYTIDGISSSLYLTIFGSGSTSTDQLGYSVAAGDVNSDGFDDILIGASNADTESDDFAGRAYLVYGYDTDENGLGSLDVNLVTDPPSSTIFSGTSEENFLGRSVHIDNVIGGAAKDLIIGAPAAGGVGKVYVVSGLAAGSFSEDEYDIENAANFTFIGDSSGTLGQRKSIASGDLDGDGQKDLILSTTLSKDGENSDGLIYVLLDLTTSTLQPSDLNGTNGFTIKGLNSGERLGSSLTTGDVNGDGYDDIIAGAFTASPDGRTNTGKTYVIFGRSGTYPATIDVGDLTESTGFVLNGNNEDDQSGFSVASGDFNNDGYSDVATGAPFDAFDKGRVYVFTNTNSQEIMGDEGFRMLTSPASGKVLPTIFNSLATSGFEGADQPEAEKANLLVWNVSTQQWQAIDSLSAFQQAGDGVLFDIFADDDFDGVDDSFPKFLSSPASFFEVSGFIPNKDAFDLVENLPSGDYQLVGNPYGRTINWDSDSGWAKTNLSETIYIWSDSASNSNGAWLNWNGSTGSLGSGEISSFNSFFVRAQEETGSLTVNENVLQGSSSLIKTNSQNEHKELILELSNDEHSQRLFISFQEDAAEGTEQFDGHFLASLSDSYLSFAGENSDGDLLTLNALPLNIENSLEMPLFLEAVNTGEVADLKVEKILNLNEGWSIYLNDSNTGESFELSENDEFEVLISDNSTEGDYRYSIDVKTEVQVSNEDLNLVPKHFSLKQNYPNPFNPTTKINYSVPEAADIQLVVYDMLGRKVATLVERRLNPGRYSASFDATRLASGIYIYRLEAGSTVLTRKMTLIK